MLPNKWIDKTRIILSKPKQKTPANPVKSTNPVTVIRNNMKKTLRGVRR